MLIRIIIGVAIGALIGFIAGNIMGMKKNTFWVYAALGIVGGAVGGFLGHLIGWGNGWISSSILAIAGSCLVIWVVRKLSK